MTLDLGFLADLEARANRAQRSELDYRASVAAEIAKREREREFAFRRLALARSMSTAVRGAKDEATALAAQRAALSQELGWHQETDNKKRILDAWQGVAAAVWASMARADEGARAEPPGAGVADAFARFEDWYRKEIGSDFLALLDHEIPERPVVEF